MTMVMSAVALPALEQTLMALFKVLDKAEAHCKARGIDEQALLGARLYPDMFTFTLQVQIACDAAKGAIARLAEADPPKWEDDERSFTALKQRISRTLDYIRSVGPAKLDGSEDRDITLKLPDGQQLSFKGERFLSTWVFPNFFFHATTAYDILRHNGVELGKRDFLNATR